MKTSKITMKARYLTFFSYIGTGFRSSEKIWLKDGRRLPDPQSVQGLMELALLKLRSMNYPAVTLSSRTDGGVHALNTSAHFDLEKYGTKIYEPEGLVYFLNNNFFRTGTSVTVKKCLRVPDNFSARYHAICRTYLYRLAVLQTDVTPLGENESIGSYIPIEEWKRCHFVRTKNFDIELLKEGAKHFVGYHDFTTFKRFNKLTQNKQNRRQIFDITVTPGQPVATYYTRAQHSVFEYWDIEIKGRAFVHNQIRRMLGALISVATGKLQPGDMKVMLQVPSKHSWPTCTHSGPPHGLYLCDVEYNPQDLVYCETHDTSVDECDSDGE